jgi:hypothetical protein
VQSPFDDVTTVRPSDVDDDMLFEPLPLLELEIDPPVPVVVEPDTLPPPAVTELVMPPLPAPGGDSPGFR